MKNTISFVFWMLFGFLLISVIKAIISTILYLYFHVCLELQILPYYIKMSSFILATFLFDFACILLIKKVGSAVEIKKDLKKLPSTLSFIAFGLVAAFLIPIKNKVDGLHLENLLSRPTFDDYLNPVNFVSVYDMLNFTIALCFWAIITFLSIFYFRKNRKLN